MEENCRLCGMPYDENGRCPNPKCDSTDEIDTEGVSSRETPVVIVLCGLPGVGKSTVVTNLQKAIGGEVLRTDRIRKRMYQDPEYTRDETDETYSRMFEKADELINSGRNVILDGTFRRRSLREKARKRAEKHDGNFLLVKVECSPKVVKQRIETRDGISDADFSTYQELQEKFEPVQEADIIDNSGRIADTVKQVAFVNPTDTPEAGE